jgi:hypothetical protein
VRDGYCEEDLGHVDLRYASLRGDFILAGPSHFIRGAVGRLLE